MDHQSNTTAADEIYALPLSYAQQRLWFLHRLEPDSSAYNIPAAFRLSGILDIGALEKSFQEVVQRHETLRTTFAVIDGEPKQIVHPTAPLMTVLDLRHLPAPERETEVQRRLWEEAHFFFDLAKGPLFRVLLMRVDESKFVLIINMHHIISDGWSIPILFREITVCYEAFSSDLKPEIAELPIQYGDYAIWQRGWLRGNVLGRQLSYWKAQLAGIPAVLNLPTDRPRPLVQSYQGENQTHEFSKKLTERIKALGRKQVATPFMTLLAAFQTLLYRYTAQQHIVVGSPIAGRTRIETENLIGFFVNTLVLRADCAGDPKFTELLSQIKETALGAYEHQDLPFERLVEELHPDRNLSTSPLFQAVFVFQNNEDRPFQFKELTVTPIRIPSHSAKFDLSLTMSEKNGRLRASINYRSDLFNAQTIQRMLAHIERLLEGIVAGPERRVSDLPLLSDAEKQQLLVEWNDTNAGYPKEKCIHELFEAQAEQTPDSVAVASDIQRLSYRELNQQANQLAHYLRKLGVGPESLVGICLERSAEMVVGLLAILKAGGAYVPLDPSYPQERLAFMVKDTGIDIILTDEASLTNLPSSENARLICLDRDWQKVAREPQENPSNRNTADRLAYVIYTSGSTGVPKGVAVPHRGVVRLLFGAGYVRFDQTRTFLQLAPISFDAATFEIWGALLHGARCVLFPGELPSPRELGEVLKKHRVDTLWLTAALFNTVIDQEPQALSEVKQLLIGGEALSVSHVRKGLSLLPDTEIINGYGPTESTTFTCCYSIPRPLNDDLASIPIGKPIGNTQVYILDPHLNPVPIGVVGELHIGGDGLARGYWNRPELTQEKFLANPFSTDPNSRLYKSGDLARYLPDGNIEFRGRKDNQVKIRGYRIELGEIEAVLGKHPAIKECVVLAREDGSGDRQLVAYLVSAQGAEPSIPELRTYLREKLPAYMLPCAFVLLDSLPLTPNGKIDHAGLLAYEGRQPIVNEGHVAPQNFTESQIRKIWQSALGVEKIGIHDNFFDLGGHSLLAVKVLSQLSEFYKIDLKPRCLFESPTIAQLAERIRNGNVSASPGSPRRAHLVELQAAGGKFPVFFVPGGGGGEQDLLRCIPLLRRIGSEFSMYALLSWNRGEASTVEELVQEYLKEVRAVQPEGPYRIVGECISGIVAYEMAQQLTGEGQAVASLTLVDTVRPTRQRYLDFQRGYYRKRFLEHRQRLQALAWGERLSYAVRIAKAALIAMICRSGNRGNSEETSGGYDYDKILLQYSPRKCPISLNLILSNDIYAKRRDGGWGDLVPAGINIVRNKAYHVTYYTDDVDSTAAHLRDCLTMSEQNVGTLQSSEFPVLVPGNTPAGLASMESAEDRKVS